MYQYATYEGDDMTDKIYLESCGADGSEKWKIRLNENLAEGEYFYVSGIYCNDQKQVILDSSRGIEIYDNQGNPVKLIEKNSGNDTRLIRIRDGKYAYISSDGSSASIQRVDLKNGVFDFVISYFPNDKEFLVESLRKKIDIYIEFNNQKNKLQKQKNVEKKEKQQYEELKYILDLFIEGEYENKQEFCEINMIDINKLDLIIKLTKKYNIDRYKEYVEKIENKQKQRFVSITENIRKISYRKVV